MAKEKDGMVIFPLSEEKDPRIPIIIEEQDNHEGSMPVKASINGHPFLIKRGHKVMLPTSYVGMLEELKYTVYQKDDEGRDVEREVPRFVIRRLPVEPKAEEKTA
jgi:Cys-tRNA synthase (O-phospho-L-seryl-tRNA:Cys-tRNA synthase)